MLTASYPYGNWKGWRVSSKDHITPNPTILKAYAIGMKIDDLSRNELISNLRLVTSPPIPGASPNFIVAEMGKAHLLIGGGFQVTDQPTGKGNIGTACYLDGSNQWAARSKDSEIVSPSPLNVFAIGIKPLLTKPNAQNPNEPIKVGYVDVAFDSEESLNSEAHSVSTATLPDGYALCGGGAVAHCHYWGRGSYLWSLEPVTDVPKGSQTPPPQTFTGKSKDHFKPDPSTITTYAIGIKFRTP